MKGAAMFLHPNAGELPEKDCVPETPDPVPASVRLPTGSLDYSPFGRAEDSPSLETQETA